MKTLSAIKAAHPEWKIILTTANFDEIVNCANCGKQIEFAGTYTSKECMTDNGAVGLPVCGKCYFDEAWYKNLKSGN